MLIVSPVRNEGAHIARVALAVASQQPPPARWIVIDDDSGDDTRAQLAAMREALPFLTILRAPPQAPGARDRLARAVEARNFNLALEHAATLRGNPPPHRYTHIMKLDGDIELPGDYLRNAARALRGRPAAGPGRGRAGRAGERRLAAQDRRFPPTMCTAR